MTNNYQKLYYSESEFTAYNKFTPEKRNNCKESPPAVIFLSGFMSDMEGSKAIFLEEQCKELDLPFIRFDYFGTGLSSGEFENGTISLWKKDSLRMIDELTEEGQKVILVGSSMGGWLMLLTALERLDKIHSIIGIAAAPDFTDDLMWNVFSDDIKREIIEKGIAKIPTDYCDDPNNPDAEDSFYPITKDLIEDGRKNFLLKSNILESLKCKATFLHGSKDEDVPFKYSLLAAEKIGSQDVEVIIKKDAKHRFSEPSDLALLLEVLKKHIIK